MPRLRFRLKTLALLIAIIALVVSLFTPRQVVPATFHGRFTDMACAGPDPKSDRPGKNSLEFALSPCSIRSW